ncbi:MAG: NTP transferase domain-containing protein [Coriobacteriales bacterium]|jgi:bifunctional UDP-N-acetylglucosamine pyrophosphorylase/glucosamine-1-phosphate N-acetyltransferase|nr:NTP transferase domain-containing protein [Coriobacteriales bacterium]
MGFSTLVLAAGAGTRMKSHKPKVAHEILGKPLLRWVVDAAWAADTDEVFVVLGDGREITAPLVEDTRIVYQDEQLGTGHAVLMAERALDAAGVETLVVVSGDTPLLQPPTLRSLVAAHLQSGATVSLLTLHVEDPTGYGRVLRDAEGALSRIVEQRDATGDELAVDEVNAGVYCFSTAALHPSPQARQR